MTYFYVPSLNGRLIEKNHSAHLMSVRVNKGQEVVLTDLEGSLMVVRVENIDKKRQCLEVEVLEEEHTEREEHMKSLFGDVKPLTLFQAQVDKHYLEKQMEILPLLPIEKICIFASDYTQKQSVNLDRLNSILTRSCEQCQRLYPPEVELLDKAEAIELAVSMKATVLACVSDTDLNNQKDKKDQNNQSEQSNQTAFLIGPEGGWSQEEEEEFKSFNLPFHSLSSIVYPAWFMPSVISAKFFFNQR
jgi:RsmE family RNA methyltransferase